MTPSDFQRDALATKSDGFYPDSIPLNLLYSALVDMVAIGMTFDAIKKGLFYGREGQAAKANQTMHGVLPTSMIPRGMSLENVDVDTLHAIIGIVSEAGELAEALTRAIAGVKPIDRVNMMEESADIDWYQAVLAKSQGFTFEQSWDAVIAKLKLRYPDKFTTQASANRDLEAERKILEQHAG